MTQMVSAAVADVSPPRSEAGGGLATNATMLARPMSMSCCQSDATSGSTAAASR
jgi:hypothetical protein